MFCGTLAERYDRSVLEGLNDLVSGSDLIGISCYSQSSRHAVEIIRSLRQLKVPIVWGGCHATLVPEDCLRHADLVCLGEGEGPLLDLANSIDDPAAIRAIPNLWMKNADGSIRKNSLRPLIADLDTLPREDFDFGSQFFLERDRRFRQCDGANIGARSYGDVLKNRSLQGFSVSLSRGCRFACGYCFCHDLKSVYGEAGGGGIRRKTPPAAIAEILHYKEVLGLTARTHFISFDDEDFFTQPYEEMSRFCVAYREKIGIPFGAHVHVSSLSEEKMKMLVAAGLRVVTAGLQSGSDRINRDIYRRAVSNEEFLAAARILKKYARELFIPPSYHVINTNPYETEDDAWRTIDLINSIPRPFNIQIFQLSFFPGSWLAKKALRDGLFASEKELAYEEHYYDAISYALRRRDYRYAWLVLHLLAGRHAGPGGRKGMIPAWLFKALASPGARRFFEKRILLVRLLTLLLIFEYKYRRHLPFMRRLYLKYREN